MSESYVPLIVIGLVLIIPIVVFIAGVLVYFLKPKYRKKNGIVLASVGSIELLFIVLLTRGLTLAEMGTAIISYMFDLLMIIAGVISLANRNSQKATKQT